MESLQREKVNLRSHHTVSKKGELKVQMCGEAFTVHYIPCGILPERGA